MGEESLGRRRKCCGQPRNKDYTPKPPHFVSPPFIESQIASLLRFLDRSLSTSLSPPTLVRLRRRSPFIYLVQRLLMLRSVRPLGFLQESGLALERVFARPWSFVGLCKWQAADLDRRSRENECSVSSVFFCFCYSAFWKYTIFYKILHKNTKY